MVKEVSIKQFGGTPLLALAQNANVNGGETLTKLEFAIMQQQMKNLGMTFEDYGLVVTSSDLEGANSKETRKNVDILGSDLNKAYKKQFGSKNNVNVVQTAELKADAIIKTALDMFQSEHPDIVFTPKSLGTRPQFTQPQYKDKPTTYVMDLSEWANTVKMEYINATKLSNEALAAMIIDNNNEQTAILSAELLAYANTILEEIENGTAEILSSVKDVEGNIIKTVRNAEGHIVRVVQDSANKVIKVVKEESVKTRNTVLDVGADIINDNRFEHAITRGFVVDEGTRTRNVLRNEARKNRKVIKRTAKQTQELDAMNSAIAERLDALHFTNTLPIRIGDLQKQIAEANVPHSVKMELLQRVRNLLSEMYVSDNEVDELQDIVNKRIRKEKNHFDIDNIPPIPELPAFPDVPEYVEPEYEKLEDNASTSPAPKESKKEDKCNKELKKEDWCDKYNEKNLQKTTKEVIKNINKKLKK